MFGTAAVTYVQSNDVIACLERARRHAQDIRGLARTFQAMHNEQGSFRLMLTLPMAVSNYADAGLSFQQPGLEQVLAHVDPGRPETRHNGLPITTFEEWLEGVGALTGVKNLGMRRCVRFHGPQLGKENVWPKQAPETSPGRDGCLVAP